MNNSSPKVVQDFKTQYRKLVQTLIKIRKESKTTQDEVAEWLKIDRKRVNKFETLKRVDIELALLYSDKLTVDVKLEHIIY